MLVPLFLMYAPPQSGGKDVNPGSKKVHLALAVVTEFSQQCCVVAAAGGANVNKYGIDVSEPSRVGVEGPVVDVGGFIARSVDQ